MKNMDSEARQRPAQQENHCPSATKGTPRLKEHDPKGQPHATLLSPIGMLCENIASEINNSIHLSQENKAVIGQQIESILVLFRDFEIRREITERRLTKLRADLKHARENLRALRQEHFGQSSERGGQIMKMISYLLIILRMKMLKSKQPHR